MIFRQNARFRILPLFFPPFPPSLAQAAAAALPRERFRSMAQRRPAFCLELDP